MVRELASTGTGVILTSESIEELIGLSDRLVVFGQARWSPRSPRLPRPSRRSWRYWHACEIEPAGAGQRRASCGDDDEDF